MSSIIESRSEIPDAPFYVLSNDTFMSGWGHAEGMTNVVIVPCEREAIANRVAAYARQRSDQKRVRIVENKPRMRRGVLYSLVPQWVKTSADYFASLVEL